MRVGDSWASSARVTASIVPGAISCPCSISSASSPITTPAVSTASCSPSSVRTLPRRNTSQSRCPSSARRTASPLPASSLATTLGSSSWLRTRRPERLPHARRHSLAVGAAAGTGHHCLHHLPHLLGIAHAGLLDRLRHERSQLGVVELGRQIALDQLCLGLLLVGELRAAAVAELLRGLQPPLALTPEYGHLVGAAFFCRLLKLGQDQTQSPSPFPLG